MTDTKRYIYLHDKDLIVCRENDIVAIKDIYENWFGRQLWWACHPVVSMLTGDELVKLESMDGAQTIDVPVEDIVEVIL